MRSLPLPGGTSCQAGDPHAGEWLPLPTACSGGHQLGQLWDLPYVVLQIRCLLNVWFSLNYLFCQVFPVSLSVEIAASLH